MLTITEIQSEIRALEAEADDLVVHIAGGKK
jgi:hypothetical protein